MQASNKQLANNTVSIKRAVLFAVSLLGDICAHSNAADALAAQLLSHNLSFLDVDIHNCN